MKVTGKAACLSLLIIFALPAHADHGVNINTASISELDTLPGVGPATAQSIIDNRPYGSIQEISKADGIGEPGSSSYENLIGHITVEGSASQGSAEEDEEEDADAEAQSTPGSSKSEAPLKRLEIAAPQAAVAGAGVKLVAQAYDEDGEPLSFGTRFAWNFGDGTTGTGQEPWHLYHYPGTYRVSVAATYRGEELSARATIVVHAPQLALAAHPDGSLSITNKAAHATDIGAWSVAQGGASFRIPEGTELAAQGSIRLAVATMGFRATAQARLFLPSGLLAPLPAAPTKKPAAKAAPQPAAPAPDPEEVEAAALLPAATAVADGASPVGPWLPYAALAAVIAAGMAGVYYARATPPVTPSPADEFDIE